MCESERVSEREVLVDGETWKRKRILPNAWAPVSDCFSESPYIYGPSIP